MVVVTVGVDLAAEPAKTAVAWIDWSPTGASVRDVALGADDSVVLGAALEADKAGIDCPLGWPRQFVDFVWAHQHGDVPVPADLEGRQWRRGLTYRSTDEVVRARTGLVPLSVAADRIAHTALRCAGLLATLAEQGQPVDRQGSGVVVEVYPAATLQQWGLLHRGYKGPNNTSTLATLVDTVLDAAPWLDLGPAEQECRRHDDALDALDALDAVIAALTARAAAQGLVTLPSAEQAELAATEGWIALPTCPLSALQP